MNDPKSTISKGKLGEDLALEFYQLKGFSELKRNYRYRRGEIDLIVRKDNLTVFVEVKYRKSTSFGHPEEFVSANQQKLIIEAASHFIEENNWDGAVRFDIIAINGQLTLEHFEDAFY